MTIIEEFKTFALRGNAIELAVGVVIGVAFNDITNSLVKDIINPVLSIFTGQVNFSDKVLILQSAGDDFEAIVLNYGLFIESVINFLIIAFVLFLVVRQMNRWTGKK